MDHQLNDSNITSILEISILIQALSDLVHFIFYRCPQLQNLSCDLNFKVSVTYDMKNVKFLKKSVI